MNSMTGFGYAEERWEDFFLSVEVKSYNNRYLDIYIALPRSLSPLEGEVRSRISGAVQRGKVEISVRLEKKSASLSLNRPLLHSLWRELKEVEADLGLVEGPRLGDFLGVNGIFTIEEGRDMEAVSESLYTLLERALELFLASRAREGLATAEDIERHLSTLERERIKLIGRLPFLERFFKENLRTRFNEILGTVDEERVLAETALLLSKASISEELARIEAHLADFRREMRENASPGRKLDFIAQELNREINTTASKSPDIEASRSCIAMKDALECIREQLRNIE